MINLDEIIIKHTRYHHDYVVVRDMKLAMREAIRQVLELAAKESSARESYDVVKERILNIINKVV